MTPEQIAIFALRASDGAGGSTAARGLDGIAEWASAAARWTALNLVERLVPTGYRGADAIYPAATPNSRPTPAVTAIASAPQKTTRIVAGSSFAPPVLAPAAPSAARTTSATATTA